LPSEFNYLLTLVAILIPFLEGIFRLTGASSFLFFAGSDDREKGSTAGEGIALR